MSIKVSTPSRLCLFGEHLDYLSLEVVTMAINLRFFAVIDKRTDGQVVIKIKDSSISTLNQLNEFNLYEEIKFNSNEPIVYDSNRDYFKSAINVIKKRGYDVSCGFSVKMDSEIPIGKGMCSSSTMIVAFIKAVLEAIDADIKDSKDDLVQLAYDAEVTEFNEPGGKMDHIASVYGGICHFDFKNIDSPKVKILEDIPEGDFILIDSKTQKDTIAVLSNAKTPVLKALENLPSIRELLIKDDFKIDSLPLLAAISNYRILKDFLKANALGNQTKQNFGKGIKKHHDNLRDGLKISTDTIEKILNIAYKNGAIGGKINGSGGGGCCYVYCDKNDTNAIIKAVNLAGYPTKIVHPVSGVKVEV